MKKLIHFNHASDFKKKKVSASASNKTYTIGGEGEVFVGAPDILYSQIVFIKDTHQICTHGELYDCVPRADVTEIDNKVGKLAAVVGVANEELETIIG